jgi:endonuclease/exonuclease/phosphatase family metal-dependent hydrolase
MRAPLSALAALLVIGCRLVPPPPPPAACELPARDLDHLDLEAPHTWFEIDDSTRTPPTGTTTIKLASWNIRRLSRNNTPGSLDTIAGVLAGYDLTGIEEVLHPEPIRGIKDRLRTRHATPVRYVVTSREGRTGQEAERYGFVYRERAIEALNRGRFASGDGVARPPYYGYFRARAGGADGFDFILMLAHTKPPEGAVLQGELTRLGQSYAAVRDRNSAEGDLLLAGDLNAGPDYVHFRTNLITGLRLRATIAAGTSTMVAGARTNDNILFGPPTVQDYTGRSGVDPFGDSTPGHAEVSDHRPVWAEFHVGRDTD